MYLLRDATESDIPRLAELGSITFIETFGHLYEQNDLESYLTKVYSHDAVRSDMNVPSMKYSVVERGDMLVGYCKIGPTKVPVTPDKSPYAELRQLYVLRSHQGHGLGTQMIDWALDELKRRNTAIVYVSVWSENLGAQRLYQRYGFRMDGEYSFMVGDHADREFIMRLDLANE